MMSAKVMTVCSSYCIYSFSLENICVVRDLDKTVEIVNDIVVHSGQFTGSKYYKFVYNNSITL